jgi:hypothetical protein
MHTFIPMKYDAMIVNGLTDHLTAVLLGQSGQDCTALLKRGLNSLEDFKQRVLALVNQRADEITGTLNSLVLSKIASLERSVEIAKHEGTVFANRLEETHADSSVYESNVLFDNIKHLNFSLKRLKTFQQTLEFTECEAELQNLLQFSVTCPSEPLFEITRTPDEYADWLLVLEKRRQDELNRRERRLIRLTGGSTNWNVGGPPVLDAITLQASCDIFLTGIGTGNGYSSGGTCSIQDIEVRQGGGSRGDLLYRHPTVESATYDGTEDNKFFKVPFAWPVQLIKNTDYTIRVCYSQGNDIWSAAEGTQVNEVDEVAFTFKLSRFEGGDSDNGSGPTYGPTRDIYFALDSTPLCAAKP